MITQFEEDITALFNAGKDSFMISTGGRVLYAEENVYIHAFQFNIPRVMRKIWLKHGLPLGCFTIQGFERRNQESKRIFQTHYNKRLHKCCIQILQRLVEAFHCC